MHYIRIFYWWFELCEHDDDNEIETITTTYLIYIAISAGANLLNQLIFILWIPSRYIRAQQIRCTCYWCWTMMCRCHVSFVFNPLFDSRLWIQYQLSFSYVLQHIYSILYFDEIAMCMRFRFLYYFLLFWECMCMCVFVCLCWSVLRIIFFLLQLLLLLLLLCQAQLNFLANNFLISGNK